MTKKLLLAATILATAALSTASFATSPTTPMAPAATAPAQAQAQAAPAVSGTADLALSKEKVAEIDAKCKKNHANVMSPEYKACVTLETKKASMPATEGEVEGETAAPTVAPVAPAGNK